MRAISTGLIAIYFVFIFGSLPMAKAEDYGALDFGAPGDAKNDKSLVHLAIGGQRLAIPRNYIDLYDSNAKEQQVVSLQLYWPGLLPIPQEWAPKFKEADFVDHLVTISLSTQDTTSWASVEATISNREKLGDTITLKPAAYGLMYVDSTHRRFPGYREFVGQIGQEKIWLTCDDDGQTNLPQRGIHSFCICRTLRNKVVVSIHFGTKFLESWKAIYNATIETLDTFAEH